MRRQAHGVLKILLDLPELVGLNLALSLRTVVEEATRESERFRGEPGAELEPFGFWHERLKYALEQRGYPMEQVRAVLGATGEVLNPLEARRKLEALPEFAESSAFAQLAATFKRVKNIARELKSEPVPVEALGARLREPAEAALVQLLNERTPRVRQTALQRDYKTALNELASFGAAVDRFFVDVLVMVDDPELRRARLSLMAHLRDLVLSIADISEMVAEEARSV
jgi:glycyl-tRNA synthetase beta chain